MLLEMTVLCVVAAILLLIVFRGSKTMVVRKIDAFTDDECIITMDYTIGFFKTRKYTKQYAGRKSEWYIYPSGLPAGRGLSKSLTCFWRVWSWNKAGLIQGDPNKVW